MPRGGKREGAGRPKGAQSKVTLDVREAAQEYTQAAMLTLAAIVEGTEYPAAARVAAANSILDRGHGKPKQSLDVEMTVADLTDEQLDAKIGALMGRLGLAR